MCLSVFIYLFIRLLVCLTVSPCPHLTIKRLGRLWICQSERSQDLSEDGDVPLPLVWTSCVVPQGLAEGSSIDLCRPGFSQNFYTVFMPREKLHGQSLLKGKSLEPFLHSGICSGFARILLSHIIMTTGGPWVIVTGARTCFNCVDDRHRRWADVWLGGVDFVLLTRNVFSQVGMEWICKVVSTCGGLQYFTWHDMTLLYM